MQDFKVARSARRKLEHANHSTRSGLWLYRRRRDRTRSVRRKNEPPASAPVI